MRARHILENENEVLDNPKAYDKLSEKELDFIYNLVKNEAMTNADLYSLCKEVAVDYDRTYRSLYLGCVRMHVLVHGILPYNLMPQEDTWYDVPQSMVKFADDKGYDVSANINHARTEAKTRRKVKNRQDALQLLSTYFKEHQKEFTPEQIALLKSNREQILSLLQNGQPAEQAFKSIL